MKKLLIIIIAMLCLGACSQSGLNTDKPYSATKSMPENMPDDFNFFVQFGVGKMNEINTYEGTVTKDLIVDGTATTELVLTNEEMNAIYKKMKEVNVIEEKNLVPDPNDGMGCMQEPHEEDIWKITINDETITHSLSGEYCEPTKDAQELMELRNYVFHIVKSRDEYKELPKSEGGYE